MKDSSDKTSVASRQAALDQNSAALRCSEAPPHRSRHRERERVNKKEPRLIYLPRNEKLRTYQTRAQFQVRLSFFTDLSLYLALFPFALEREKTSFDCYEEVGDRAWRRPIPIGFLRLPISGIWPNSFIRSIFSVCLCLTSYLSFLISSRVRCSLKAFQFLH